MKRLLHLLLPAVLCLSHVARAEQVAPNANANANAHAPLDATASVDQHDAAARQYYRTQRFDDALREYEAAYRLSMEPIFLFNSAQVLRAKGSYSEAVAKYELFMQLEQNPNNPERLQATSYIRDMRRLMEMQEHERVAKERERLAQESERLARESERLAREQAKAQQAKERPERSFRAKLAASPSYRNLYATSYLGVDLGLMLGGQLPRLSIFFSLDYFLGSNLFGMLTMAVRQGLTLEGIVDPKGRFRVGGSLFISILAIQRITQTDYMVGGGVGISAHGTVDVKRWGEHAMYLGLRLGLDGLLNSNDSGARPVMVDLTTLCGFRL